MSVRNYDVIILPDSHCYAFISDLDECENLKGILCHHGKCINTVGNFRCECDPGFQIDRSRSNCTGNLILAHFPFKLTSYNVTC